jgi:hypothetical protein
VRFLGTPDPLPDGLRFAQQGKVLEQVGGPRERDRERLQRFATSGVAIGMIVPKLSRQERGAGEPAVEGVVPLRVICRARSTDRRAGEVRVGLRAGPPPAKADHESLVPSRVPDVSPRSYRRRRRSRGRRSRRLRQALEGAARDPRPDRHRPAVRSNLDATAPPGGPPGG